jgi:hypothetical protein
VTNTLAYYGKKLITAEQSFMTQVTGLQCHKTSSSSSLTLLQYELECLSLANLFRQV